MADPDQRRFLWLYPLASAGAYIAFLPLLTIIMPLRAEALAGDGKVTLLSEVLLAGICVATAANVLAGAGSDWTRERIGTRMPWLWVGLAGTWLSFGVIGSATGALALGIGLMMFQLCFNLFYGPFVALLADKVPDHMKGRVSAFANLALPCGMLASSLVGLPWFTTDAARLAMITVLTGSLILPLLILSVGRWRDINGVDRSPVVDASIPQRGWRAFCSLWIAKCLVQFSGNVMTSYFLFYLQDEVVPAERKTGWSAQSGFAAIIVVATILSATTSIVAGRWSDRSGRRKPFLLGAITLMICGIATISSDATWAASVCGYSLFVSGLGSFLTIDVALVAQILPSHRHRGRDLGIMNAANTVPALLAPVLALTIFHRSHDSYSFLYLILVAALAGSATTLALSRALR